jgi:hypothetical protein
MGLVAASWESLDAEAAMAGIDLLDMPPVRVANIIWSRLRQAAKDEDDWRATVVKLTRPLPGRPPSAALRDFRRSVLS